MTSQPRKFSEKIALHNQKQAEGDAAFQQIMREVTDVTSNVSVRKYLTNTFYTHIDRMSRTNFGDELITETNKLIINVNLTL